MSGIILTKQVQSHSLKRKGTRPIQNIQIKLVLDRDRQKNADVGKQTVIVN